ncbi:hypothetical protein IQ22_04655 [Pseudomonas duriflava]|uniref:PAS domain-containing protein n=1 Tax=Pseudomonas duriflava TaxID=459528 RepID=A0A562PMD1_9PSED|nr:hypothetical protein IQ22_04655 [Pseudomonas duriflava]
MAVENSLYSELVNTQIISLQHDPCLFGTPLEGLITIDSQGRITGANRAAQRLLGVGLIQPGPG